MVSAFTKDAYKNIVLDSLRFMHRDNRVRIYAFVIMPNHLHIIWKIVEPQTRETVQRDFLKFTSQQLLFKLQAEQPHLLEKFKVNAKDRMHQLWQRGALNILLYNDLV